MKEMRAYALLTATVALTLTTGCASLLAPDQPDAGGSPAPSAPAAAPLRPMARKPAGLTVPLAQPGQLTVCGTLARTPYAYSEASKPGKSIGFDVELLTLVAQRLGVTAVTVQVRGSDLFSPRSARLRRCDLLAGGFQLAEELGNGYAWSTPYLRTRFAVLTRAGSPGTLRELAGRQVAVAQGSPAQEYLATHAPGLRLVPSEASLVAPQLQAERLDAAVLDRAAAYHLVQQRRALTVGEEFGEVRQVAFLVPKGNQVLRAQLDAALLDAASNGHYARAHRLWFGREPDWRPGR